MGKWEEVKLGKLCQIIGGGTPSKSNKEFYNGHIPWASVRDMNAEIIEETEFKITEEAVKKSSTNIIKKGSIIIATRVGLGKVCFAGADIAINQDLKGIIVNDLIDNRFLFFYFKSIEQLLIESGTGATVKGVKLDLVKNLIIPLPPLPEQKRIVTKLDALFAEIDQAIGLLEENITHTQALMGSVLDKIYSQGDTELKEVCIIGPKKSELRDLDDNLEVSFLPMKDLNEHDINFNPNEIKKLSEVYKGYTYFADGDVILAKVTPCFENGKAGLAKNLTNGIGFGSSEYHILRSKENVLPEWIYFAVLTEQFRVTGKENMTGAGGLKRVPRSLLEDWKIPVPSLSIQKKQIKRIVQIQEETKKLEASINKKLTHLKSLKSSSLDQAFKGEL